MRTLSFLLLFATTLVLSSCGTVFCSQGEVPALTITSNIQNAEVYINGKYVGITPYSHFGEKCDVKKITIKKDGYKNQSVKPRKLKGWAYVNFVPWPMWNWIWGYFLDRSKSKCWKYKNDTFNFQMERK